MRSKIIKTSIWLIIICGSSCLWYYLLFCIDGCKKPESTGQDSSMIKMNDSLKLANLFIDIKNMELNKKLDSLLWTINKNDSIIKLFKTKKHEKVSIIYNLNDSDLYKFLSDTSSR